MTRLYKIIAVMFISLGLFVSGADTQALAKGKKCDCPVKKIKKAVKKTVKKVKKSAIKTKKVIKHKAVITKNRVKRKVKKTVKKVKRTTVKAGCAVTNKVMDTAVKARNKVACKHNQKTWVKGHYKKGNNHHTSGHLRKVSKK